MPGPGDKHSTDATVPLGRMRGQIIKIPGCTLRVVEGPDRGREVTVEGRALKVGKGAECDLRLTDESVSRSHAAVSFTQEGYVIEDLGSTNGTEVNGVFVKTAILTPGCKIRMGETTMEFTAVTRKIPSVPVSSRQLAGMLGGSPRMREAYGLIRQVAPTEATVVIRGETGTGKEVAAHAIHSLSPRSEGPFVVFDCANINRDLLGSELFGHQKGAFTGALAAHRGAFERAHGGTLFLDEIGDLPLDIQSRLLGVLQRREVQPLGSESAKPVDTRVLAATHRDLEAMSQNGGFREDLYFRLAVITLDLPALRERREDIPDLAMHFLEEFVQSGAKAAKLTSDAILYLQTLPWRGNVRELRNVMQRAVVLASGGEILPAHFGVRPGSGGQADPTPTTLEGAEKQAIRQALERNHGNKSRAARELGIALSTLKRKVKDYGLAPDDPDDDE